ncbi:DUF4199 domain-containing protein [Membranicola marinus]|uniref:DUF4199 domain-containing protein n=1 Tax=Membranihabitans marinus TaxID=1227546 RepID=A0A953HIY9_9BACT|nr:DUF4199 domain-containing protein [Membranihabitans marinus]MBY5956572.1 DUF4199 domain-containing protein [Membranihabitans marinus]
MEKKSVNLGLIAGGAIVVIMFVVDIIDNHMMVHFAMSYFPTLLLIVAMFLSAREAKKDYNHLAFSDAFKEAFIPFMVGNGIYMIFNYFLYNFIDPELGDIAREKALEIFDNGVFDNILTADQRELMIETTRENTFRPTLGQSFTGYLFSLILPGGLVALILAAIYRTRSKPSFTEADSDEQ